MIINRGGDYNNKYIKSLMKKTKSLNYNGNKKSLIYESYSPNDTCLMKEYINYILNNSLK